MSQLNNNPPLVSTEAWDIIKVVLEPSAPDINKTNADLIDDESRRLVKSILTYRLGAEQYEDS